MIQVRLMPEYECHPLWVYINNELNNISPASLLISEKLINDLDEWSDEYHLTYNKYNPVESGFLSTIVEKNFFDRGCILKNRLQLELGSKFEVILQI